MSLYRDPKPKRKIRGSSSYVQVSRSTFSALFPAGTPTPLPRHTQQARSVKVTSELRNQLRKNAQKEREKVMANLRAADRNAAEQMACDFDADTYVEHVDYPMQELDAAFGSQNDTEDVVVHHDLRYVDILETVDGPLTTQKRRRRNQSRREKRTNRKHKWDLLLDSLTDALLSWRAAHTSAVQNDPRNLDVDSPPPQPSVNDVYFTMDEVCGFTWLRSTYAVHTEAGLSPVKALIQSGLLTNAPDTPRWAISIKTLEMYRSLRCVKPNLSVQAFVKSMSFLHGRTYYPALSEKFIDAFDVYLSLLRNIERRLLKHLKRDAGDWHLKHFCPCCTAKVEGEPSLPYSFAYSIDGGSSLKRFADAGSSDVPRPLFSTSYLSPEKVDEFKEAVKKRVVKRRAKKKGRQQSEDETEDDASDVDVAIELGTSVEVIDGEEYVIKNVQGDATDLDDAAKTCVARFKAARKDDQKGMFSCFEQAGTFTAVCKHGLLILWCDMLRSGELAKYPLAIVRAIENAHPDVRKMSGYDIWCTFVKTLLSAGITINGDGTTLAMHGYCHNRMCQIEHHPLYKVGLGLADMEQCERSFASSNEVAVLTRHASAFHRHQFIDMHVAQANKEKLENLGLFIFDNYSQALSLISELKPELDDMQERCGFGPADYESWLADELAYLCNKEAEPEDDNLRYIYVDALHQLWKAEEKERKCLAARTIGTGRRRTMRSIYADTDLYLERCNELEAKLGIVRWTTDSLEYQEALKYCNERSYRLALNKVELLTCQRLLELSKCHQRGTNYKVRVAIAKHLQARSKTIRSAVKALNKAARAIKKPAVSIDDILSHSFLQDFHLLLDQSRDLSDKPWAKPSNRNMREKYFKYLRAQEELLILHVEIGRLGKWMREELDTWDKCVKQLQRRRELTLASWAHGELRELCRICNTIIRRLNNCAALPGYTGPKIDPHPLTLRPLPGDKRSPQQAEMDDSGDVSGEVLGAAVDGFEEVLIRMERHG